MWHFGTGLSTFTSLTKHQLRIPETPQHPKGSVYYSYRRSLRYVTLTIATLPSDRRMNPTNSRYHLQLNLIGLVFQLDTSGLIT